MAGDPGLCAVTRASSSSVLVCFLQCGEVAGVGGWVGGGGADSGLYLQLPSEMQDAWVKLNFRQIMSN